MRPLRHGDYRIRFYQVWSGIHEADTLYADDLSLESALPQKNYVVARKPPRVQESKAQNVELFSIDPRA